MAVPPQTQRAIVVQDKKAVLKTDQGIAPLRPDSMLVRVKAIAINPTDWKHAAFIPAEGCVQGVDFAGIVEKVADGKLTRPFKKGDRISGTLHGSNQSYPADGTFAEWAVCYTNTALVIPDSMSFEDAATFSVAILSCGQGLYEQLGLPLPHKPVDSSATKPDIMIYGASTATGTIAVQLAKLSGARVLAVCSPHNYDLVKSRGADEVFDYNSSSVKDDIRASTNDTLSLIFDCIGEDGTPEFCYEVMGPKGGKYSSLLFPVAVSRNDITITMVMAYNSYGQAYDKFGRHFPADREEYEFAAKFFEIFEGLLQDGKLVAHPIDHREGGLEAIPQGYEDLQAGRVSGKKLVYTVS